MMMSRRSGSIVVGGFLGFVLLQLQCGAAHKTYVVGDDMGWTIPTTNADSAYKNWASNKVFQVGDVLSQHDVVRVPKESYDKCTSENAKETHNTGPVNITLSDAGDNYFICGFGTHCAQGQKLTITVSTSTGPSSSPSPTSPGLTPPPGSSAAAVYATSFLVVLSVVIGMAF